MSKLILDLLPKRYAICRLPTGTARPERPENSSLFVVVHTPEELTIVVEEGSAPSGSQMDTGWRALRVRGPLDLSLIGVLSSLAAPLAKAAVGIFVVSSFDTDYVLIREDSLERGVSALVRAGHVVENAA